MVASDGCQHLWEIHLVSGVTDQGLVAMAPNLGTLKVLGASKCGALTDVGVIALTRHCLRMKELNVSRCKVSNEGIAAVPQALVTLKASFCEGVMDAGMVAIGQRYSQQDTFDAKTAWASLLLVLWRSHRRARG
eukprot:jgi/Mesvir1/595/Mv02036-RA.1